MHMYHRVDRATAVALRKESVDRNFVPFDVIRPAIVALRKESVDRNDVSAVSAALQFVALRKESVDRNIDSLGSRIYDMSSLSARRAWIEMCCIIKL